MLSVLMPQRSKNKTKKKKRRRRRRTGAPSFTSSKLCARPKTPTPVRVTVGTITWLLLDWVLPNGRKRKSTQWWVTGIKEITRHPLICTTHTHSLNQSSNWMAETIETYSTHTHHLRPPWTYIHTHTHTKLPSRFLNPSFVYTFLLNSRKTWATGSDYVEQAMFRIS